VNPAKAEQGAGGEYVDRKEFRLLLTYLRDYFELHVMFSRLDSDPDGKLSLEEFEAAVPQLMAWGMLVDDAKATLPSVIQE